MSIVQEADSLMAIFKSNPILATGLGLWGAAMLTFITKDIPNKLVDYIKREFTTAITVSVKERELVSLTKWALSNKYCKRPRSFILRDETVMAGEGLYIFIYKFRVCWFERKTSKAKEISLESSEKKKNVDMNFSYIGRKSEFLIDLYKEITKWDPKKNDETHIFTSRWTDWQHVTSQPKRHLDQLVLTSEVRSQLTSHLNWFFSSSDYYQKHGIPYRTGICLHGPPGTGKTSLVRAIAAEWGLSIYYADFSNLTDTELKNLIWKVGNKALILIEDIDTISITKDRSKLSESEERGSFERRKNEVTLGGLLNAMDGVVDSDGRVFVMTTNFIEKIDPALLRPGRVNLSLKLDYLNSETLKESLNRRYSHYEIPSDLNWREDITPAYFQAQAFQNPNRPENVVRLITKAKPRLEINHG